MAYNYSIFSASSNLLSQSNRNMSSLYGEYNSIRSGSYKKLLRSYYAKQSNATDKKASTLSGLWNQKPTSADKTVTTVKSKADSLAASSSALTTKGKDSLFVKKEVTKTDDKTGEKTTSKEYDMDKIVKAIKSFASDYNSMLDAAADTSNTNILKKAVAATNTVKAYSRSLSNIGITVGSDNKLTVEEEKLKTADVESIKSLFQGTASFAGNIGQKASQIAKEAVKAATNATTYASTGNYNMYNYFGSSYSSYF